LDVINRGQKFKVISMKKKANLDTILKFPNEMIDTTEFVDVCVQKVYELLLEYSASQSHSIAFPELLLVGQVRLKKFIKNWKNPSEGKMLKQVLDKMIESSRFIEDRRRSVTFNIADREKVQAWEKDIQLTGTPLTKYYEQWKKVVKVN
jgi:nucleolar complex protein 2